MGNGSIADQFAKFKGNELVDKGTKLHEQGRTGGNVMYNNRNATNYNNNKQNSSYRIEPKTLGSDYVELAEQRMSAFMGDGWSKLTTSKIRNILSMVSDIYNETKHLQTDELPGEIVEKIQHLRIRLAYESGRDRIVQDFIAKMELMQYIKGINNSKDKFIRFANYMEALVAYHRYFGGKES